MKGKFLVSDDSIFICLTPSDFETGSTGLGTDLFGVWVSGSY